MQLDYRKPLMAGNNAFWREVIDYLPNLVLVFRIDVEENAQLIFCNKRIQDELGYTAREFVLASETEGTVKQEIDSLVEVVARRSRDVEAIAPPPYTLTTKRGGKIPYCIYFRVFKTKAGGSNLIAVELLRKNDDSALQSKMLNGKKPDTDSTQLLVYESSVMQSVLETLEEIGSIRRHVLLRGEYGTGKRTLARRLLGRYEPDRIVSVNCEGADTHKIFDTDHFESLKTDSRKLILQLIHLSKMTVDEQHALCDLIKSRDENGAYTRIIATSRYSLEEQVEEGDFYAELYYYLGFQTVLVPPLRHRKEDIRVLAQQYVKQAAPVLNLGVKSLEGEQLQKLESQQWNGNFPELYEVLRRSLLESNNEKFEVRLKEKQEFTLFPEQQIAEDEILGFDEMNKRYLERILNLTGGKIYGNDGAAALLDLKPTTLQSKLKRLGIK